MIKLKQFFICVFLLAPWIHGEQQIDSNMPLEDKTTVISNNLDSFAQQGQMVTTDEDDDKLFDIRPEVVLPHHALFYCLTCFLGLLILFLSYFFIKKWRNKQTTPAIVAISPYAKALQSLDAALEHIQQKDKKPFAFGITDSVRQYLADVFNLPAPESTTEEVLEKLKKVNELNEDLKITINQLLKSCDLAKFTQQEFNYEMRLKLYHKAKEIIQEADKCLQQKLAADLTTEETHASI